MFSFSDLSNSSETTEEHTEEMLPIYVCSEKAIRFAMGVEDHTILRNLMGPRISMASLSLISVMYAVRESTGVFADGPFGIPNEIAYAYATLSID